VFNAHIYRNLLFWLSSRKGLIAVYIYRRIALCFTSLAVIFALVFLLQLFSAFSVSLFGGNHSTTEKYDLSDIAGMEATLEARRSILAAYTQQFYLAQRGIYDLQAEITTQLELELKLRDMITEFEQKYGEEVLRKNGKIETEISLMEKVKIIAAYEKQAENLLAQIILRNKSGISSQVDVIESELFLGGILSEKNRYSRVLENFYASPLGSAWRARLIPAWFMAAIKIMISILLTIICAYLAMLFFTLEKKGADYWLAKPK